ncbi:hypothetical protein [Microbacterium sp. 179-I 3D4 NHS]|uniref:hypothetical protein n=1 Tax=Microbacterium sp. 179-I 3D4 NHS TaxID=3142381 RepID=UPI0039A1A4C1
MSTPPPPAANDDSEYDGPDDDLASGNISDADFAHQHRDGRDRPTGADPASGQG